MNSCKSCGNRELIKYGIVKNKQRYLCKACGGTWREGDDREKYSLEQRIKFIKLYTEGMGLRAIARTENISAPLLVHWVRTFTKMLREKLRTTEIPDNVKEIEILEIDELFTYYQKKHKKPMYGLLWTETGIKLLISS
jgi:transposase-like protein